MFLSYRQIDDAQRLRVRAFAEKLRGCGITVILDQFFMDANPGGPPEGWPKWSSDQAIHTKRVLIVGSKPWFQCFDGKQKPGTGLGAACEAGDIRQRIYDAAGINEDIRVVLFEKSDSARVPFKLKGYHRFDAERDFDGIVKWLGGTSPQSAIRNPHSNIPHNLPHLPFFYGRTEELRKIADALSPKTRTWGALIDGPGGIGKTSLAIRAALEAPEGLFRQILFVSSKSRKLTADGEVKVTDFVVPGYIEMLNEIARLMKQPGLAKSPEADRARLVIEALEPAQALLILDNLESLPKDDQNRLFEFLSQLPPGCKAIVTSRRRTDQDARIIRLAKLEQDAALALLAELEDGRPLLKKAGPEDRIHLYEETGGNPLLIRWVAGQLGRGRCRTIASALDLLRSAQKENDPLEFIFGDLLDTFTEAETKVLAALTYFTQPVETKFIAELASISKTAAETALGDLADRALVIPDDEEANFGLVPMAAAFLRNGRPEAVKETGIRLERRAYALIVENGYQKHDRFPVLDAAWPTVAPAIPVFLAGENARLQTVCYALTDFLNFTGRWDEWLSLAQRAEVKALATGDHGNAGSRAYDAGWVHYLHQQADAVLACADRAAAHWQASKASVRENAFAIRLRGIGHQLKPDYPSAIAAYREAHDLWRSLSAESVEVAIGLTSLGVVEQRSGEFAAAERDFREALRVSRVVGSAESMASVTGNLADLARVQEDWPAAEALAREALALSKNLGRQELIAHGNLRLAHALVRQSKAVEALPHAERAVAIFTRLSSPDLTEAAPILAECRAALLSGLTPGWTYNTTTLEGNTLTKAEVAKALADPNAKIARPPEHVAAARAQQAAIDAIGRWLAEDRPFTKHDLFALHTVLMHGSTVDSMKPIGTWKIEDNGTPIRLDGETKWNDNYAAAHHTDALMETWLAEFNKRRPGKSAPFDDYIWLHATFARIHPFADGNGRLARLLATVPLVASGQPVVDIPAEARDRYMAALARWQFACGAPLPNKPLFPKESELKDFIALCKSSQIHAEPAKPTPKKKTPPPAHKPTRRPKK